MGKWSVLDLSIMLLSKSLCPIKLEKKILAQEVRVNRETRFEEEFDGDRPLFVKWITHKRKNAIVSTIVNL